MITIIHGEDTATSRNYYFQIKKQDKDSLVFDGNKLVLSDLVQLLEGSSLFNDPKNIFIEDFLTKRKGKDAEDIATYIEKNKQAMNIFFWEGKDIGIKTLSQFKNATIQQYKYPQVLFAFLDSLEPHSNRSLMLFHELLEHSEPELVFFMLQRQFRILLGLSGSAENAIDEVKRLSPWQKSKYQRQIRLFSEEKLKNVYKKLLEIETGFKTGTSPYTLTQAIDFFLLDL